MSPGRAVLKVGLTGGIAAGKTTVARFFADLGAFVLDADRVVHELLAPGGAAYDEVLERFGEILFEDGNINRELLGQRVFADPDELAALNAIVHPHVRAEIGRRINAYRDAESGPLVIVDAALLVETGAYRDYDRLVVVRCDRETQLARLTDREGMTDDEAQARVAAQAPLEDKLAVADYIIDTETHLDETRRQTDGVYNALLQDFESLAKG
jgi:dephospho-CoA kinase